MKKPAIHFLLAVLLVLIAVHNNAQSLSFTQPESLLPSARTDRAIDITNFKGHYFITWKEPGRTGNVHVCYLGKQYDTVFAPHEATLQNEQTAYAPVLRVWDNRIYLLWIATDGTVKYLINHADTSIDTQQVYSLRFNNPLQLGYGITASVIQNKMVITSHSIDKDKMVFALAEADKDGILQPADLQIIPGKSSSDYPFVVTLSDSLMRIVWRGYKNQDVYWADYNVFTYQWTDQQPVASGQSRVSPAVYRVGNANRLFYVWKGPKNDNRLYYMTTEREAPSGTVSVLPAYFSTANPAAICKVDDDNFIMSYVGLDQKIYLSFFSNYSPASWMGDLLMKTKSRYTLKDIVIPGSHDAGMSVLTSVGGTNSSSVNECNTLTQSISIGKQLNAGIRMFDLRVGTFQNELYTKHCSADCMSEALGGAYGEKLGVLLKDIRAFLKKNSKEIVILSFSHFCEKETPMNQLIKCVKDSLGTELIYQPSSTPLKEVKLQQLAGKVILAFEGYTGDDKYITPCTMQTSSDAFLNFRREYAATNDINKLNSRQEVFFSLLKQQIAPNDLVRLDWQLTQSGDEAAMVCNNFQSDKTSPLINGAMLLTSIIKKHQSIVDLAASGNKYLAAKVNQWIAEGLITHTNKPNILYVDVAGNWITDYCIDLNRQSLYSRQ